jgi:hypothetical protein
MNGRLTGEQELQRKYHQETLAKCLAADHHYVEILKQRIAAADCGEFASDKEVEVFFAESNE